MNLNAIGSQEKVKISSSAEGQKAVQATQSATAAQNVLNKEQVPPSETLNELKVRLAVITKATKDKMAALSEDAQSSFDEAIKCMKGIFASFQARVLENNRAYPSEVERVANNEKYQAVIAEEGSLFKEICQIFEGVKSSFSERRKVLETTSRNHIIERALLQEAMVGNDSLLSPSNFVRPVYRFGANFRLYEMETALQARMNGLGLKPGDKPTEETAEIVAPIPNYDLRRTLKTLLGELVALKEHLTIYHEAFRKGPTYETALNSDWPKVVFLHYKKELERLSQQIKENQAEQADRIFNIDTEIKTSAAAPDSPQFLLLKGEREELKKRFDLIVKREEQCISLLNLFKQLFTLSDEELAKEIPSEEIDLGPVHAQVTETLGRVVAFKEELVAGNAWEAFAPVEQRRVTYFQSVQEAEKLSVLKKAADVKMETRVPILEQGAETYRKYLETMRLGIEEVEGDLKKYSDSLKSSEKKGGGYFDWLGWNKSDPVASEQVPRLNPIPANAEDDKK